MRCLLALVLAVTVYAQPEKTSPTCEELQAALERPVDEYIKEINKRERKRTKNPLPDNVCIFGWCTNTGAGPKPKPPNPTGPFPPPAKRAEIPPENGASGKVSSSQDTAEPGAVPAEAKCPAAAHDPIGAAKNVDIADYYMQKKNYRAALSRYKEALEQKPGDPAIHLRLGRTHEMLEQREEARKHYQAAADAREGFWTVEAKEALRRVK
jgi:tetratricopeptide (TPR) repeat protein